MPPTLQRWLMTGPGEPLVPEEQPLPEPGPGEALVEIAGCGICHTDLGFLDGGVRTRHPLPLTLGHEISGRVAAAGPGAEAWAGREVVVPAVLPCGECALCRSGRENACQHQKMPGNDFHGGFASHILVPARWLVDASGLPEGVELADVAVLADAVTTPYQAAERARIQESDMVVLVGAGGIGSFGVQIAAARGARVLAVDVDEARLERAARFGAAATVCTRGLEPREARKAVRGRLQELGHEGHGLKVLEMSGTPAGQELAWSLLEPAGTVGIVGFCLDRVPVRLSSLMAFDADAFGNWGCRPALYGPALDLIREGRVQVTPFVRRFPLDRVNEVLDEVRAHRLRERPVLQP